MSFPLRPSLAQPHRCPVLRGWWTPALLELLNFIAAACVNTLLPNSTLSPFFTQPSAKRAPSQRESPAHSIWNTPFATRVTLCSLPALCFIAAEIPPWHVPYLLVYYLSLLIHPLWFIPWNSSATSYNIEKNWYFEWTSQRGFTAREAAGVEYGGGHVPHSVFYRQFSRFAELEFIWWQSKHSKNLGQVGTGGSAQARGTGYLCPAPDCLPHRLCIDESVPRPVHTLF